MTSWGEKKVYMFLENKYCRTESGYIGGDIIMKLQREYGSAMFFEKDNGVMMYIKVRNNFHPHDVSTYQELVSEHPCR